MLRQRAKLIPTVVGFQSNGEAFYSGLKVVIYKGIISRSFKGTLESLARHLDIHVRKNNWYLDWYQTGAVEQKPHFHTTAHEAIIVLEGKATIHVGDGSIGPVVQAGDAIFIPAGVRHWREGGGDDFTAAGIYPKNQIYDMRYGTEEDYQVSALNVQKVRLPESDPFFGKWSKKGTLLDEWK